MRKKIEVILLALVLAISCAVPAFAATTYKDLTGHWAKTYLEDLAGRGLMTGYSDGTMRPDSNMTTCQLLVLLSRMYSLTDAQKAVIEDDYGAAVQAAVDSSSSWAYENLDICLAAGIVTADELKTLNLSGSVNKEEFALFLTRAMQLSDEAASLPASSLTYQDAASITEVCRGSVAELATLGIVKGNTKNQFLPASSVTRAVAATMISRALDYLEAQKVTLTLAAYAGYTQTEGILTAVSDDTVSLCGFDGYIREYTLSGGTAVTVNGVSGTIDSGYVGQYAKITLKSGAVARVAANTDSSIKWVQGTFYSATSPTSSSTVLTVKNPTTGVKTDYTLSGSATVTLDGKSTDISSVSYGDFVTVMLQSNKATRVCAVSGDSQLSGSISELDYGTTTTLKLLAKDGGTYCFSLNIASLPTVKRGDTAVGFDRLKVGDAVTVTVQDFAVTTIQETAAETTVTGVLASITTTVSGTTWVITPDAGAAFTLTLDGDATAFSGTTSIGISDIRPGDKVTATVYSNTIVKVSLQSRESVATKLTGTVLYVDTAGKRITALTSAGKLVYVSTASAASILSADTGKTISLSGVQPSSNLIAYGTYTSSAAFTATSVVIE